MIWISLKFELVKLASADWQVEAMILSQERKNLLSKIISGIGSQRGS
jgi:hypothetical protein